MDIQKRIKDNAEDLRRIFNEMNNWENDMKRKENTLLQSEDADPCDVISLVFMY